jgi:hypothetical protein
MAARARPLRSGLFELALPLPLAAQVSPP